MKYLIVNIDIFSKPSKSRRFDYSDLPEIIRLYIEHCNDEPFIILDESSKIKTTAPVVDSKKSLRTRRILLLQDYGQRVALTGTLMSKSPLNLIDQYNFLNKNAFPRPLPVYAQMHCVMVRLPSVDRPVVIPPSGSPASWEALKRTIERYKQDRAYSEILAQRLLIEYGLSYDNFKWIQEHDTYTPFKNVDRLTARVADITYTATRADIFDTDKERFVHHPIIRKVKLSSEQRKLYREFVSNKFTGNFTIGRGEGLELMLRLSDVCNGFEPISPCVDCPNNSDNITLKTECPFAEECKRDVKYRALKENPKVDYLMELLEEIDTDENQVVIWCCRRSLMSAIEAELDKAKISWAEYSGRITDAEKNSTREKVLNKKVKVCIANQKSASYGVNFMKDIDYEIFVSSNASAEEDHQARNRLLRGVVSTPKFCYRIECEGTVESQNNRALELGESLITAEVSRDIFELEETK